MSKVLITGATGFIGNHVARLCLDQGDEVRAMVMPGEDRSPLAGMEVEFVEGNLLDPQSLAQAVQGVDKLYHLAALFAVWTKDPDLHYKINVEGTRHLMRAALAAGLEKIVYTSSIAAIGTDGKGTPSTEETPFASWHFASPYILSKYISHLEVKGMVKDGLPVTMVMPGLPFGPGDRAPTPTGTMIIGALQGKMKNYWDGGVCPVDVRDVAAGHVLAMDKGRVGESYILGNTDNNMSNQEFLQLVGRVAGIDNVGVKEISRNTMLRVARLAELFSKLTGKAPITTVKNSTYTMEHFYVDSSKAVRELGLPQTPVETAVRDSIEWFRANGYA
ncbi:NAD-dependent epimerase/dehydratase family protein [Pseudohalioglobus sediminis]|uniref:NAD-dependent epimerase/dehydratase family protein n=1 Tax=Pseudohalioglobus sediminis TaxID=2606449 RepID=A0A5B0WZM9_9GAMM|nr:SDR family oxidoreductase [Pseudohalioglobus sediminis]KAA1191808.1 NAD-dependent epimerase/dehydratase family protein [Pseudohalioglobus sediminis]